MNATGALNAALSGRYAVEREIGRGGMATVYLARDIKHDRHVALKVLNPELGAVLGVERFLSEIRVTANLQHPHLLPLFDSGEADGLLYYVMPYVTGETLRAKLEREKQLPIDEALRISIAILSALAFAHSHGVIHRDLKPENILLQSGEPVIADFGIALAVSKAGGQRVTQTGLSLGTPQYMSPEQATGDRTIDARSDIYSMGAMLYEMLSGEPPHSGSTVQAVIARVITERPRSLRSGRDTVPENVDAAVMRALAKLPADRWGSAQEFADALRGSVSFGTTSGRGTLWVVQQRVHRLVNSTSVLRSIAAVLLLATLAFAWLALRPRPSESFDIQLARQLTFDGNVVGTAISPDGNWLAYVSDDCFGRGFSCSYTLQVREVDGTQAIKLATWPVITGQPRWSPDGSTVAFIGSADSTDAALYLIPRLGGSPLRVPVKATAFAFTAGGKLIAAEGAGPRQSLVWVDPHSLARTDSAPLPSGFIFEDLSPTPDGNRILATTYRANSMLLLLDGRGTLLDSTSAIQVRRSVRWDASHDGVIVSTPAPGVADNMRRIPIVGDRFRLEHGTIILGQVSNGVEGLMDVAQSGRLAVVAGPTSFEIALHTVSDPTGKWTPLTKRTAWVWGSDFSPDGTLIAGSATDNVGENSYLFPLTGGPAKSVTALHGIRDYPYWSADARHLAYDALTVESSPIGIRFIDVGGGRERVIAAGADRGTLRGWVGSDAVALTQAGAIAVLDTAGRTRRQIVIPDSLAMGGSLQVDAATKRAAYWSASAGGIVVVDLVSGKLSVQYRSRDRADPIGWTRDGTLFAVGSVANGKTPGGAVQSDDVVMKLVPGASAFSVVTRLPAGVFRGKALVAPDGQTVMCVISHYTPDVWLADRGGRSGW